MVKRIGMFSELFTNGKKGSNMKLIEEILSEENLNEAIKRVKANKGASGIDKMQVSEIDEYFRIHKEEIKTSIREMKYKPQAVRRPTMKNQV